MIVAIKRLSEGTTAFMLNVYLNNINKQYNLGVKIHKVKIHHKNSEPQRDLLLLHRYDVRHPIL